MGLQAALRIDFDSPRATRRARIAVPIAFGLYSLILGADGNWDLYNYHLYNAYAFLNGKLAIDFAPAGFQSYFNPLLDVPYYLAITHLPPPLVGFLMGAVHGLNFLLVLAIAHRALPGLPAGERNRMPLLLALAGVLTANFLSQLGSTMGDNMTALFVLASVALAIRGSEQQLPGSPWLRMLLAGGVMGVGTGLKLTNAPYAVALCLGLLAMPGAASFRLRLAFAFGVGVLAGVALSAGFWFATMAQAFGNPLFPQFGSVFPNPLAASIGVADSSWLPKSIGEYLLWPFLISADALRVGQVPLRQIVWALVYLALLALGVGSLLRSRRSKRLAPLNPAARLVVAVVGLGFVLWMLLFSVYRYLVPLELLGPLVVFIALQRLSPFASSDSPSPLSNDSPSPLGEGRGGGKSHLRRLALIAIAASTLLTVLGGAKTWGHNPWSADAFRIDVPPSAQGTAVIVGGDPPWAWLAAGFPKEVAFTQIGGNFPEGPGFRDRILRVVRSNGGAAHAIVTAHHDSSTNRAARLKAQLDGLGLTSSEWGCATLRWAARTFKARAEVKQSPGGSCDVVIVASSLRDVESENRAERDKAAKTLASYGFAIAGNCSAHRAEMGGATRSFQWCPLAR